MEIPLFIAETISLTALDAKADAPALAAWSQDSRHTPLMDTVPPHPRSTLQAEKMLTDLLKEADGKRTTFWFGIRPRGKSELLGMIG
ncbi:MAG: hypothetical protein L3J16_04600 [Anaerolineales bacterium]|nr:hypothetical protein [Anaerolineales bacterium]